MRILTKLNAVNMAKLVKILIEKSLLWKIFRLSKGFSTVLSVWINQTKRPTIATKLSKTGMLRNPCACPKLIAMKKATIVKNICVAPNKSASLKVPDPLSSGNEVYPIQYQNIKRRFSYENRRLMCNNNLFIRE